MQRLVELLDDLDGDADDEPADDDEPTLGSGFEDGECEPSLGSLDREPQDRWSDGGTVNSGSPAFECEADAGDEGERDEDEEEWRQVPRLW